MSYQFIFTDCIVEKVMFSQACVILFMGVYLIMHLGRGCVSQHAVGWEMCISAKSMHMGRGVPQGVSAWGGDVFPQGSALGHLPGGVCQGGVCQGVWLLVWPSALALLWHSGFTFYYGLLVWPSGVTF